MNQTLTLTLAIRKKTYSYTILLKSVSYYCYCSISNGIFHPQSRAFLLLGCSIASYCSDLQRDI